MRKCNHFYIKPFCKKYNYFAEIKSNQFSERQTFCHNGLFFRITSSFQKHKHLLQLVEFLLNICTVFVQNDCTSSNGCVSAEWLYFWKIGVSMQKDFLCKKAKCLQNACVYENYCFSKKVLYLLNHFFLKKYIRIVVLLLPDLMCLEPVYLVHEPGLGTNHISRHQHPHPITPSSLL